MAETSRSSAPAAPARQATRQAPAPPIFRRSDANPILIAQDLPFRAGAVLNPGAAEHQGEVVLLLRVESVEGYSGIHVARSADGVTGWSIADQPLRGHGDPDHPYEAWGSEDARVTYMEEGGAWYITYVAYSPMGPAVGLARTRDFVQAERLGLLGTTNDKDAVLLPRRFNGRWTILHRPNADGREHIWASSSLDLVRWGEARCVMFEGIGSE